MADNKSNSSQGLRPDGLATSVAILLAVSVVQRFVGFGRGVLFCRWLTPEELGYWELAYSFMLLAAPIIVFGVPGSLGRYLERYRQRNQLRAFLGRTMAWTGSMTLLAIVLILAAVPLFSELVFGTPDKRQLVCLMAISLVAIILHHFLECFFAALRLFRIVSTMHFCQSMSFAAISLTLLCLFPVKAENIVFAYGLSCALSAAGTLLWMRLSLGELELSTSQLAHREFWPPLMRFAIWVWVSNLLCHLFDVVDRYMIVHHSGMDDAIAMAQVGNYHSSRIVPLLFVSVAELLAGVIVPYLSHDWEAGRRENVYRRVNLILKLTSFAMLAGGVVVLWLGPWMFHVAFGGKYDAGMAILPWTLTYCVLYSLVVISMTYLWCAERTRISSLPLAIGLAANIGLNLVLLPRWGLSGAVIATTTSTIIVLTVLIVINIASGMRYHVGTLVLMASPLALCLGPIVATCVLVAFCGLAASSKSWLTASERTEFIDLAKDKLGTLLPALRHDKAASQ